MTSVWTATTDVVISLKSNTELRKVERNGTEISRISVILKKILPEYGIYIIVRK